MKPVKGCGLHEPVSFLEVIGKKAGLSSVRHSEDVLPPLSSIGCRSTMVPDRLNKIPECYLGWETGSMVTKVIALQAQGPDWNQPEDI